MEDAHERHDDEVEADVNSDGDNQEAEAMEIVGGGEEGAVGEESADAAAMGMPAPEREAPWGSGSLLWIRLRIRSISRSERAMCLSVMRVTLESVN